MMEFNEQECLDLVRAIREAQAELCTAPGMNEAIAYDIRLNDLVAGIMGYYARKLIEENVVR